MKMFLFLFITVAIQSANAQFSRALPLPVKVPEGTFRITQQLEPRSVIHFKAFDMRAPQQAQEAQRLQQSGYLCENKTSIYRQCRRLSPLTEVPDRVIKALWRKVSPQSTISFAPPQDLNGELINDSPGLKVWKLSNPLWIEKNYFKFYEIAYLVPSMLKLVVRNPDGQFAWEALLSQDPNLLRVYFSYNVEVAQYEYYQYIAYLRYQRVQ